MGIGGFFGWVKSITTQGGRLYSRNLPGRGGVGISSLSIDMNSVIHNVLQAVYGYRSPERESDAAVVEVANEAARALIKKLPLADREKYYFEALGQELLDICGQFQAVDTLILAVDGVIPASKIQQQRKRRYRVPKAESPAKSKARKPSKTGKTSTDSEILFDTNAVTPGTQFMFRLDAYLTEWIRLNRKSLPTKVIYSSHLVPGEGEHKIMDLYRAAEVNGELAFDDGVHILYGPDADLIVLSLLSPVKHLYVHRDGYNVNIQMFRNYLTARAGNNTKAHAVHDFAVITPLVGNDFLPNVPGFLPPTLTEAIELCLRIYSEVNVPLTILPLPGGSNPPRVNWAGLACFLTAISRYEQAVLQFQLTTKLANPFVTLGKAADKGQVDLALFRRLWYQKALGPKLEDVSQLSPEIDVTPPVDPAAVGNMAANYLTGIGWVYQYYTGGPKTINPSWLYHYHYAPLIYDLASVARKLVEKTTGTSTPPGLGRFVFQKNDTYFTPIMQLLSVIPPRSAGLLPEATRGLLSPTSLIADFFPLSFVEDNEGTNKEHQATLLMPFVNRQRLEMAMKAITGPGQTLWTKPWQEAKDLFFILDQVDTNTRRTSARRAKYQSLEVTKFQDREQGLRSAASSALAPGPRGRGAATLGPSTMQVKASPQNPVTVRRVVRYQPPSAALTIPQLPALEGFNVYDPSPIFGAKVPATPELLLATNYAELFDKLSLPPLS